ncbi:MAG: hypothetical protein JOZ41_22615, partial [Chloroflexi bacterium]|nr:hypothetical protein [Chloroflexota bacterium]
MQGAFNGLLRSGWSARLTDELTPRRLVTSLSAAALMYFVEMILVTSFAALIFTGPLAGQLPAGLGWLLAGN